MLSNEEIAARIQAGEEELYCELWAQCSGLVAWKARHIMTALNGRGGVELDDLVNSGYPAMVEAVASYRPEEGAFSTWLMYHLQNAFAEAAGYKTKKKREDPINNSVSLQMPIGDGEDAAELFEVVEDPGGYAAIEYAEETVWREQLHQTVCDVLSDLPADLEEVLTMRFLENKSQNETSVQLGFTREDVKKLEGKGLKELRKPVYSARLKPFLYFDFYSSSGLGAFRSSGMSIEERYLVYQERREKKNN